jgi:soluble lytic murein transglycosylase-like protein
MGMMRGVMAWLICGSLLAAPLAAHADIYRFVDRNGVEHYTNFQPPGGGWLRIYRARQAPPTAPHGGGPIETPDPDRIRRYDAHIREAAQLYVLPEEFIRAVMHVESNFNPRAVSRRGAVGLMQLMPSACAAMGVVDPFDPRQNVLGGVRLLRVLANSFAGDERLTLAAYNAGEAAVRKYGGIPPFAETQRYVERVLARYAHYRAERQVQPSPQAEPAPQQDALARR